MQNDLLPSLELVSKMIQDVEVLEEKAEVAKHESSIAGTSILTKVGKLKEMLNHAKEANDMVCSFMTSYFTEEGTPNSFLHKAICVMNFMCSMLVRFLVRNLF